MRLNKRILTSLLPLLLAVSALAQDLPKPDASRVLALSVAAGSQKNTRWPDLSAEAKAEVEGLEQAFRAASAQGKFGEAMKDLHHAQAVVNNFKYTPLRAMNSDLVSRLDHAILEPGQTVTLKVGFWYPLDEKPAGKLNANVLLMKAPAGPLGVPAAAANFAPVGPPLKTQVLAVGDWSSDPVSFSVTIPDVADGTYMLAVDFTTVEAGAESVRVRTGPPVIVAKGLGDKAASLKARLAKTPNADPSAAYRAALYDLVSSGDVPPGRIDFSAEFAEAGAILDAQDKKTDPWAARKGDLHKAYRSAVDNTLQPYRAFVPASYDGKKSYPLVVALHGMGGDENGIFDGYLISGQSVVKAEAERRGYLVVCPKGRGSASMYTGAAERDVLDAIAEMERVYKVDESRIYLTGHSMGGYGTWSLAQAHPDMFAALGPISGGGNAAGMTKLRDVPQIVIHGDNDKTVPVERSREMVEAAKKAGTEIKYVEVPGGSHGGVAAPAFPAIFDWFDAHPRKGSRTPTDMPVQPE